MWCVADAKWEVRLLTVIRGKEAHTYDVDVARTPTGGVIILWRVPGHRTCGAALGAVDTYLYQHMHACACGLETCPHVCMVVPKEAMQRGGQHKRMEYQLGLVKTWQEVLRFQDNDDGAYVLYEEVILVGDAEGPVEDTAALEAEDLAQEIYDVDQCHPGTLLDAEVPAHVSACESWMLHPEVTQGYPLPVGPLGVGKRIKLDRVKGFDGWYTGALRPDDATQLTHVHLWPAVDTVSRQSTVRATVQAPVGARQINSVATEGPHVWVTVAS